MKSWNCVKDQYALPHLYSTYWYLCSLTLPRFLSKGNLYSWLFEPNGIVLPHHMHNCHLLLMGQRWTSATRMRQCFCSENPKGTSRGYPEVACTLLSTAYYRIVFDALYMKQNSWKCWPGFLLSSLNVHMIEATVHHVIWGCTADQLQQISCHEWWNDLQLLAVFLQWASDIYPVVFCEPFFLLWQIPERGFKWFDCYNDLIDTNAWCDGFRASERPATLSDKCMNWELRVERFWWEDCMKATEENRKLLGFNEPQEQLQVGMESTPL